MPRLGGYAANLLFDEMSVRSLFDSYQSAKAFLRFSEIYVNESQAGNSYGGYFPSSFSVGPSEPFRVLFPRPRKYWDIWAQTVDRMYNRICVQRSNLNFNGGTVSYQEVSKTWERGRPRLLLTKGYHSFFFKEDLLPPRIQPTRCGDFVAVVDDPKFRRECAYFLTEIHDKALIILHRSNTSPKDEQLVLVERKHLMCVHDFYLEDEYRREKCGYRLTKEALISFGLRRLQEQEANYPSVPKHLFHSVQKRQ